MSIEVINQITNEEYKRVLKLLYQYPRKKKSKRK